MSVWLVIWEWMNNGMGLPQYNGMMVKQILKVIPTTAERIDTVLGSPEIQAMIYHQGRYRQWEVVFKPDNSHLEEVASNDTVS